MPSRDAIVLSLKTMNKALETCREMYTRKLPGSTKPLLEASIAADSYKKDMETLDTAQHLAGIVIADPDKAGGRILVAILSTADDFAVGVASTRLEVLKTALNTVAEHKTDITALLELDTSLKDCQTALFNAGGDYVEIVIHFAGWEDDMLNALAAPKK